jgi:hypothetical protein
MQPILILILLAALSADKDPAAKPAADQAVTLELSPVDQVGPQAKEVKGPTDQKALEVTGDTDASTSTILVVENPKVTSPQYVLKGRVKYEGVKGTGYLELWNDFGDKGYFFTRGLGSYGPLKSLNGTSDWRDFEMPFYAQEGMTLKRLTLNVVLPGKGTVVVSEPLVVEPLPAPTKEGATEKPADEAKPAEKTKAAGEKKSATLSAAAAAWWTEPQAGLIGGIGGSVLGTLGGLIGATAAWGKSRGLTLGLCFLGLVGGTALLIAGLVALAAAQPWHVCYPLLLCGGLAVVVLGANLRPILRRFQTDELRKMSAVDVG